MLLQLSSHLSSNLGAQLVFVFVEFVVGGVFLLLNVLALASLLLTFVSNLFAGSYWSYDVDPPCAIISPSYVTTGCCALGVRAAVIALTSSPTAHVAFISLVSVSVSVSAGATFGPDFCTKTFAGPSHEHQVRS